MEWMKNIGHSIPIKEDCTQCIVHVQYSYLNRTIVQRITKQKWKYLLSGSTGPHDLSSLNFDFGLDHEPDDWGRVGDCFWIDARIPLEKTFTRI